MAGEDAGDGKFCTEEKAEKDGCATPGMANARQQLDVAVPRSQSYDPVMSHTLTVEYPDRLPDDLNMSRAEFERDARLALAAKLFELGRLSSAQAARIAGLDRVRFLLGLERFGVSAINLDEEELTQEFAHARKAFAGDQ